MIGWFRRRRGPEIRLETRRFVLNTLTRDQAARLSYPWSSDPGVVEPFELAAGGWSYRNWRRQTTRTNNRDRFAFGITVVESGALIGYETVQISRTAVATLGVLIGDRAWWGRGVVVETRAAVLDFLFDRAGCVRAMGVVHARNLSSVSNYLALGFRHEGTLRDHFKLPEGRRGDAMVFGMLRAEWLARRTGRTGQEPQA